MAQVDILKLQAAKLTIDKEINLSIGDSRHCKKWQNKPLLWSEFLARLAHPTVTQETVAEYQKMPKNRRDAVKDVGGFVGGFLKGGSRKSGQVQSRSIVTLDADSAYKELWEDMQLTIDYCVVMYTTHSHTKTKPRYRFIIPLTRPVTSDEYEPIARKIASQIGMDYFDDTTYQPERLMYWPSHARDGDYRFDMLNEDWVNPDDILSLYPDWRDTSYWPESSRAKGIRKKEADKQGDPLTKKGAIGVFCRLYTIAQAIETFLPEVYLPTKQHDRYTYAEGSTSGGLVVYEDKFAYSHHGTDVVGDTLVNAFDLVRLHKFGHLDAEVTPDTTATKLPSYNEMMEFVLALDDVKVQMLQERQAQAIEEFDEWDDTDGASELEWVKLLEVNSNGTPLPTAKNLEIIFKYDTNLKDCVQFDIFANRLVLQKDLSWRKIDEEKHWKDSDDAGLRVYLEKSYGIANRGKIEDAFMQAIERHVVHPVRDYLNSVSWDGVKRVDTLLIDYLGAEDTEYTRIVTRKFLVAAVARIFNPGIKFDNMLVTTGPQGIGKTLLPSKLAGEWFSNSLDDIRGKDAYEALQGTWIMEMGELTATKKADIETIKHFISKQEDIFRQAYGRRKSYFKRQCVFWGTTNDTEFLRDRTGNRRFWPVQVGVTSSTKKVWEMTPEDVAQIWAECKVLRDNGESLYLTAEQEALAKAAQQKHSESNMLEGRILEYLNIPITADWYNIPIAERREYIQQYYDDDLVVKKGEMERDKISVAEVWYELLGGEIGKIHPAKNAEIRNILANLDGWEKYNKSNGQLRLGPEYGRQVVYIKNLI